MADFRKMWEIERNTDRFDSYAVLRSQKKDMLISIVVPVYNVEKYLSTCVDSILKQSFKDYEIILVDDGSTDKSGSICDEYAKECSVITVIHKKNGGLSDARNAGLRIAKGEYILFVDADDYIGNESLNAVSKRITDQSDRAELVFLEAVKVYPDGTQEPMGDGYNGSEINGKKKNVVMKHLATLPKFPGSACTKLVSRNLLEKHKLYFQTGLLSEDIDWTIRLLKAAQTFAYVDTPYYYYRQNRVGSITNTADINNIQCILSIIEKWSSRNRSDEFQGEINAFMAYEYIIVLYNYALLNKKMKRQIRNRIQRSRWVLKYGVSKKEKCVYFVSTIFGIRTTTSLLKHYKRSER